MIAMKRKTNSFIAIIRNLLLQIISPCQITYCRHAHRSIIITLLRPNSFTSGAKHSHEFIKPHLVVSFKRRQMQVGVG